MGVLQELGLPNRSRTCDLRLRRPLLYPAELWADRNKDYQIKVGRGGGIRTHDPLLPKQMRYHAALLPDKGSILHGMKY